MTWHYFSLSNLKQRTKKEYFIKILKVSNPTKIDNPLQIEIANDQCFPINIKEIIFLAMNEGDISWRVHLEKVDQQMMQGDKWKDSFHNGDKKEDLIKLTRMFFILIKENGTYNVL